MAKRKWAGTPAQRAALRKAQLASARARRGRAVARTRRFYSSTPAKRGVGVSGLQRNTVPYARINKRSGTVGVNSGTIIPFTGKRIAVGGYIRLENTNKRNNPIDRNSAKIANKIAPKGSKRGAVRSWFNDNVYVTNPAIRANVGHAQVRLGTSRGAGATVIVRGGRHKTPQSKSRSGVRRFDKTVNAVTGTKIKKTRRQRRGK